MALPPKGDTKFHISSAEYQANIFLWLKAAQSGRPVNVQATCVIVSQNIGGNGRGARAISFIGPLALSKQNAKGELSISEPC